MEKKKMYFLLDNVSAENAEQVMEITEDIIRRRQQKGTAPSGTPKDELHGASLTVTELANIGRNIVGEGGIQQGMDLLMLNAKAKGIVEGKQSSES